MMSARPAQVPSSTSLTGATWRRSSRSVGMNNCVETARLNGELLAVRDSQRIDGPALLFGAPAWQRFISTVTQSS
ncbi:DUF397 domain-containing protein [Streptomyces sp. NPDC001828]|uniref:DUF397 domain-containing protein n=1 Tax=Streptomyces sp. NPDC001828 TaxID=3364615 RepID=UPI003692AE9B